MKMLKFRFWHTEEKKMYRVFGLMGDEVHCIFDSKDEPKYLFKKKEGKLMQFIGRTDMNDVDIYECDYVKQHKDEENSYTIVKVGHLFCMRDEDDTLCYIPFKGMGKIEIIGNAFESPNLEP